MKTVKYTAILIAFLSSFSVQAVCPTQQTTIFFANGVNVDKKGPGGAEDSRDRLKAELIKESLKDSRVRFDCIQMDLAYNTNEPTYVLDFVEAFIQKSAEFTGVDNFPWVEWQNTISTSDWFLQVVEKFVSIPARTLIETGRWVLGDQRDEHVLAYQTEIAKGRKVILAAHSQGTINAGEERLALSLPEQSNVNIVGAAAFAFPEPDELKYTTMDEDKLAIGGLGLSSLPANIFLTPGDSLACQPAVPNPWYCHNFIRSYMGILPARDKIVSDIIASLPTTPKTQFSGTITNSTLFLTGFVPDSDSWVFTRGNYDTPDYDTWVNSLCLASPDTVNLAWLTTPYVFSTGPTQEFLTGVNLNDVIPPGPDECGSPGTFYLAVYDFNGSWRQRIFKGVLILHRIDATHWVGEAGD